MHVRPHVDMQIHFVTTCLEEFIFTCTASLRILAASTNTTLNFDNLLAFSPLTQTHLDFRNAVWYATCNNMAKPWIDFDSYDASLSWGLQWTTWIYNHFPSHIKYFGSHIAIIPTKFWNNCNLLGGLTTQAQQWLNFDAVLADFPLAYKHSNLNFRHCNLVQPSSKLAAEALLSETGTYPVQVRHTLAWSP